MIVVDTSALLDSLTGRRRSAPRLRAFIEEGEQLVLPALVLFEWLRGPRLREEVVAAQALFPFDQTLPFGETEAALAARLYHTVRAPRGREIELAIAASAIAHEARLWTLQPAAFAGIPDLRLV